MGDLVHAPFDAVTRPSVTGCPASMAKTQGLGWVRPKKSFSPGAFSSRKESYPTETGYRGHRN